MAFFRILREVKNAETARTRKHPYASYDFVARSSAKNRILNVNLRENKRCVYMCVCVYGAFPHYS